MKIVDVLHFEYEKTLTYFYRFCSAVVSLYVLGSRNKPSGCQLKENGKKRRTFLYLQGSYRNLKKR